DLLGGRQRTSARASQDHSERLLNRVNLPPEQGTRVKSPLRILHLEDSQTDADLIVSTLAEEGIACEARRIDTKADFVAALEQGRFDLIIADYSLPSFDGIAHDFNNLLMIIMGYSELLLNELDQAHHMREKVEETQKAAQRAVSLVRQLLAFSRKQVLDPQVVDLNAVVGNLEKMLRRLI